MIETRLDLSTLVTKNHYTIQELIDYGFGWDGFVALGLTITHFKEPELYNIDIFTRYFPHLTITDLLLLPPNHITLSGRITNLSNLNFSPQTLKRLAFSFELFFDFILPHDFIAFSKTITLKEMTQTFKLSGRHLAQKDLLNRPFFAAMGWKNSISEISLLLDIDPTSIPETTPVFDPRTSPLDNSLWSPPLAAHDIAPRHAPASTLSSFPETYHPDHNPNRTNFHFTNAQPVPQAAASPPPPASLQKKSDAHGHFSSQKQYPNFLSDNPQQRIVGNRYHSDRSRSDNTPWQ